MESTRTCRLVTLGCKVNQYETQHVQEALEASGYRPADDHTTASGKSALDCLQRPGRRQDARFRLEEHLFLRQPNLRPAIGDLIRRKPLARHPGRGKQSLLSFELGRLPRTQAAARIDELNAEFGLALEPAPPGVPRPAGIECIARIGSADVA